MTKTITFKKIFLISLCSLFTVFTVSAQYSGGDGSTGNPYLIVSLADLETLSTTEADWDKHFIQTADIEADATAGWNGGEGFSPIGSQGTGFSGSYDGQGFVISNLTINRPGQDYVGLFGRVSTSISIVNTGLLDCAIDGQYYVGALIGNISAINTVENCYASGTVNGYQNVGGLIGVANGGSVSQCFSSGSVSSITGSAGGLIGSSTGIINNCYSHADVTGDNNNIGGLIGQNFGDVANSYSTGLVTALGTNNIGGLAGYSDMMMMGNITNSFYDEETSGQNDTDKGEPKSTVEMQTQSTFTSANWDFIGESTNGTEDIWEMKINCETIGYPVFSWQGASITPPDGNLTVSATPLELCENGTSTVTIDGSETGVSYYLRKNSDNEVIDGPVEGNGGSIDLLTNTITTSTDYNLYAEKENTDEITSNALRFTGNAGQKKVSLGTTFWDEEFAGSNQLTVEAWVNPSAAGNLHTIMGNYEGAYPLLLRIYNDQVSFYLNSGIIVSSTATIPTNTWTHIAATYDGATANIYINGVLDNSSNFSGNLIASSNEFKIGGGLSNGTEYFPGDITEVRMWNVARTAGEIADSHVKQLTGNEYGLVTYYQFSEGSGTTAYNTAANGLYEGTLINAPEWVFGPKVTAANCFVHFSDIIEVTVYESVEVDILDDVEACGEYVLADLTTGDYYTETNGGGNPLNATDAITESQMLYIFAENGACTDESSFTITIDEPVTADVLDDVQECGEFVLPDLTTGGYYTETNGGGNPLNATDAITESQTLFIFAENGLCSDESSFTITIDETVEADVLDDVNQCGGEFVLPDLTTGDYYTETNGGGNSLNATDAITESQTLFIFAENGLCSDESSFDVTIHAIPDATVTQSEITLTAVEAGLSYQWLDCDDSFAPITGETGQSFTAESNGNFAVEISNDECSEVSDCFTISTVSVHEASMNNSLTVYPNPGNGTFFIEFGEMTQADILVRDIAGRIVYRINNIATALHEFQLNGAAGVYLLEVNTPQKRQTFKLIKQ